MSGREPTFCCSEDGLEKQGFWLNGSGVRGDWMFFGVLRLRHSQTAASASAQNDRFIRRPGRERAKQMRGFFAALRMTSKKWKTYGIADG